MSDSSSSNPEVMRYEWAECDQGHYSVRGPYEQCPERYVVAWSDYAKLLAAVQEWLCETCNTIYPGPPQAGLMCVVCPKCSGNAMPRSMAEIRRLEKEIAALRAGPADNASDTSVLSNKDRGNVTADETGAPQERWPCPYCQIEFTSRVAFNDHIGEMRGKCNAENGSDS